MTSRIPWGRLLAEAVMVVASILLAFAIDAAWDRHRLREEEREVLLALEQELEEVALVIEAARDSTLQAREYLLSFLESTPAQVASIPSSEVLDRVYSPLSRQWGGAMPRGALDAATGSGQLAGVRDPSLRAALARLGSRHAHVNEIRGLIGDLDIRTAAVLGEFEGMFYAPSGELDLGPETLRAVREDPRIRGAASAKFGFLAGYLGILSELEKTVEDTLLLIREAVSE